MESWLVAGALSLGVLTSNAPGQAQTNEPTQARSFTWKANPSCATADELIQRIEARLPRLKLERRRDAAVQIRILEVGAKVRAELVILLEDKEELTRSIEASDCKSALETISFIAAVALDPGAERPLMIRDVAEYEKPTPLSPANEPDRTEGSAITPADLLKAEWRVGVTGSATWGPAPSALFGGELYVSQSQSHGGLWAPGFRVSAGYARRGGFQENAGRALFELFDGSLDLCPSQWGGRSARLQVCGAANAGVLRATGSETFQANQAIRPWAALGAALNLGYSPTEPLWIDGRFGAVVPLIRDEFLFDDSAFHRVWPVSLSASLGVALRFR